MPRKPARTFTPQEVKVLEQASALNMTKEDMAKLVECSYDYLNKLLAKDVALRNRLAAKRAASGFNIRQRLYQKADKGDMRAIEFYCKTQLGFRTTDRVELTGPDGRPIATSATVKEVNRDDVLKQIQAIQKRMQEKYE